jgi:hypothetical protein
MSYPSDVHHFLAQHLQIFLVGGLPMLLMFVDASAKYLLDLRWETYGADTAFCGITTLTAAIVAAPWTSAGGVFAAMFVVAVHGVVWGLILKLASKGKRFGQVLAGATVFYSAVLFAIYYSRAAGL